MYLRSRETVLNTVCFPLKIFWFFHIVAIIAPAVNVDVKLKVCPVQSGVFAPGVGAEGFGLTVTETVPVGPAQPNIVAFTE